MRIGLTNMTISKLFPQKTAFSQHKASTPSASGSGYHRNTLEDLLSGHYKNSYGVEGMVITKGSNRKRIMEVSDEMKQHVFNDIKNSFYNYYGMSDDNETEQKNYNSKINSYLKTLKVEDRSATSWTLGQMKVGLARTVTQAIKAKVPTWTEGKPISHDILDEIFSDESLFSPYMNSNSNVNNNIDTLI